jgi:hypothetical protein
MFLFRTQDLDEPEVRAQATAMYIGLTITSPADEITRFREAVRGRDQHGEELTIDFRRVIPIPSEITDPFTPQIKIDDHRVIKYLPSWGERNWGASSNALYTEILQNADGVFWVQFDVEYDFPDEIVEKIVASFPQLVFEGSAFKNDTEFYMSFQGRNGKFTWEESDYKEAFGEDEDDDDDSETGADAMR